VQCRIEVLQLELPASQGRTLRGSPISVAGAIQARAFAFGQPHVVRCMRTDSTSVLAVG